MSDLPDMYNNEDELPVISQTISKKIINKGMIKEVDIDGEKLSVIDPNTITQLRMTVRAMQQKITSLEVTVSNLSNTIKQMNQFMRAMQRDLDNKVSYE